MENPFLYGGKPEQLERFFLLSIFVAGKHAGVMQKKLDEFLRLCAKHTKCQSPFSCLLKLSDRQVREMLTQVRTGQYTRISRAIRFITERTASRRKWLSGASRDELTECPGVGMKSASFFILYTRYGTRVAALDTHILAYMREQALAPCVPESTPSDRKLYLRLEQAFLQHADELGRDPAELDFSIWKSKSKTMKLLTQM